MTALLLTSLAATLPYALACWLAPFGHCNRCHGQDRHKPCFPRRLHAVPPISV